MTNLRSMMSDPSARQFTILSVMVAITALVGGSSRVDVPYLIFLRPALVLLITLSLVLPTARSWRELRVPLSFAALLALSMLIQLVPVPSARWLDLPGHERYAAAVAFGNVTALPISLAPDLTINSLLALLPAVAVLVTYSGMQPAHRWATAWFVPAVAGVSLLIAISQLSSEKGGYLYGNLQDHVAGLLTNRNHQALLLAVGFPVLAVLARRVSKGPWASFLVVALLAVAVASVPMLLLTGSRQGMALAVVGVIVAMFLAPWPLGTIAAEPRKIHRIGFVAAAVVLIVVLIAIAIIMGRAESIRRLSALSIAHDVRLLNLPTIWAMTKSFFPIGIGYGAFNPVYRGFEPDALLHGSYFNHAHDDLLELVLTGGVPALLLIAAFLLCLVIRAIRMMRSGDMSRQSAFLDRSGLIVVALFLTASLVDYPLRAPIMSLLFTLALCWIWAPPSLAKEPRRRRVASARGSGWHRR